jgi:Flp pilus assembly secretin CpaC
MLRYLPMVFLAAAFTAASPVLAAESIQITADQSTLLTLPALPSTVVVGNPSIADVTLDGQNLFVHPRGPGLTNIVVLGTNGSTIADYRVHVVYDDPESVAVYSPAGRDTYSCASDCEPVLRVGDSTEFFKSAADQIKSKSEIAAAQALGGNTKPSPAEIAAPTP